MIEQLTDLPDGVLGFRASGKITPQDYREQIIPPVRAALEHGEVSLVFATAPDFAGLETAALWEDARAGMSFGLKGLRNWRRIAVVTDKQWLRHAVSGFGWISPGEYRLFDPDELDAAIHWVSEQA
jgi:hypothetical protein